MPSSKISGLPAITTPLAGTAQVPVVQTGSTKAATVADIRNSNEPYVLTGLTTGAVTAATAGTIKLFARNYAGRIMPEYMAETGVDCFLQGAMYNNMVAMWAPGASTTAGTAFGMLVTSGGTISHQTMASTNMMTAMRRTRFASATSAGSACGLRANHPHVWRGNAANMGGFFAFFRFAQSTNVAATQAFIGLASLTGALAGEPSDLTDMIGIGYDTTDAQATGWQLLRNDASGTATKVTLTGAPRDTATVLDLTLYCPPNSSSITVRVYNQSTQSVVHDNVAYTTDLPTSTVFLTPHAQLRNGATTSAVNLELSKIYLETDI